MDIMNQVSQLSGLCLLGAYVYVIFYRLGYCSDIADVFVNRYIFYNKISDSLSEKKVTWAVPFQKVQIFSI